MILEETYTMSNGVKIPKIALGTWLMSWMRCPSESHQQGAHRFER